MFLKQISLVRPFGNPICLQGPIQEAQVNASGHPKCSFSAKYLGPKVKIREGGGLLWRSACHNRLPSDEAFIQDSIGTSRGVIKWIGFNWFPVKRSSAVTESCNHQSRKSVIERDWICDCISSLLRERRRRWWWCWWRWRKWMEQHSPPLGRYLWRHAW